MQMFAPFIVSLDNHNLSLFVSQSLLPYNHSQVVPYFFNHMNIYSAQNVRTNKQKSASE